MPFFIRSGDGEGIQLAGFGGHHAAADTVELDRNFFAFDLLAEIARAAGDDVFTIDFLEREIGVADADGLLVLGVQGDRVAAVNADCHAGVRHLHADESHRFAVNRPGGLDALDGLRLRRLPTGQLREEEREVFCHVAAGEFVP